MRKNANHRYAVTGEDVVTFYIKNAIKNLEIVENYDERIEKAITYLAKITKDYPNRNPKQNSFDLYTGTKLEKLSYDCKQI